MKKTENYNLKLPETDDFYNVEDMNENFTEVDRVLGEIMEGYAPVVVVDTKPTAGEDAPYPDGTFVYPRK